MIYGKLPKLSHFPRVLLRAWRTLLLHQPKYQILFSSFKFLYVLPLLDVCIFLFFFSLSIKRKKRKLEDNVHMVGSFFPTLLRRKLFHFRHPRQTRECSSLLLLTNQPTNHFSHPTTQFWNPPTPYLFPSFNTLKESQREYLVISRKTSFLAGLFWAVGGVAAASDVVGEACGSFE